MLIVASWLGLLVAQAGVPLDRALDDTTLSVGGEKYVGVTPGARNPLPKAKPAPPHLIWTGFQPSAGGGGRVFIQTNAPVSYEVGNPVTRGKRRLVKVLLKNCRIHHRNNSRRMDTRFFVTPVEEISARHRRKNVELEIQVKEELVPQVRVEAGPDGTHFLVLEFGTGATPVAKK